MEDSMDMDMSPLRPQNYLFGCELKADRDYHFKVDNDENEDQLSLRTHLLGEITPSGKPDAKPSMKGFGKKEMTNQYSVLFRQEHTHDDAI
ncbi:hypothetical protein MG293_015365 [Ovis ammon polii]|uniref:Nucleophosmin n=1 Tax=Ovis ammon polii TaxID=230172 RepID=A0AAD4Y1T2_OVIAM|nr:hypothetical protein MG293_015365 [Ovis ammon polii]